MDPTLIGLLILFMAGSALTYYFGFLQPPAVMQWRIQAAFVVLIFLLVPSAAYLLYMQAGAVERLARSGMLRIPGILHVVGITAGQGDRPVWVFAAEPDSEHDLAFYDDPATRQGWAISERGPMTLILSREGQRMSVTLSKAW